MATWSRILRMVLLPSTRHRLSAASRLRSPSVRQRKPSRHKPRSSWVGSSSWSVGGFASQVKKPSESHSSGQPAWRWGAFSWLYDSTGWDGEARAHLQGLQGRLGRPGDSGLALVPALASQQQGTTYAQCRTDHRRSHPLRSLASVIGFSGQCHTVPLNPPLLRSLVRSSPNRAPHPARHESR